MFLPWKAWVISMSVHESCHFLGDTNHTFSFLRHILSHAYLYLTCPIDAGELRFQRPQVNEAWTGTRDATAEGPMCPQPPIPVYTQTNATHMGTEDCLYLNVYTPKVSAAESVSLFFLGGGGGSFLSFFFGGGKEGGGGSFNYHLTGLRLSLFLKHIWVTAFDHSD